MSKLFSLEIEDQFLRPATLFFTIFTNHLTPVIKFSALYDKVRNLKSPGFSNLNYQTLMIENTLHSFYGCEDKVFHVYKYDYIPTTMNSGNTITKIAQIANFEYTLTKFSIAHDNEAIYITAGLKDGITTDEVRKLEIDNYDSEPVQSMNTARSSHGSAVCSGKLYVFGGNAANG